MLKHLQKLLNRFLSTLQKLNGICRWLDPKCKAYTNGGFLKCTCGKGESPPAPPPPPAPPAPAETSREAIQAQIDATPRILETQKEFGPQFTQLDLDQLRQFGPEFAQAGLDLSQQFGTQFAEQAVAEQNILDPSRAAGGRAVNEFITAGPEGLTDEDIRAIEQSSRSAAASRGFSQSGFSAKDEIFRNFGARQALKDRFLNVSLSAAGRLPSAQTGSTVQGQGTTAGQLVQNVSPQTFFGGQNSNNAFNQGIFATQGSIFGNQLQSRTARRGQSLGLIGDIVGGSIGAAGSIAGAAIGSGCWVASELFGGWYHPKTCAARNYINNIAPKWFKDLYLKHGESFAKFISNKPMLKIMLKPLFELFAFIGKAREVYYG